MHSVTNRDVWEQIVKFFQVSLSDDSTEDVKLKRSTLLSIALVRSELTTIAVSELWRSIATLEPIIHAFNPPPFRVSSPAFVFKHDNFSNYCEMVQGPEYLTNDVKLRVRGYLSHVKYLHFTVFPSSKERALWLALQAFNWINPLCPNLRGITFTGNNSPSLIYHVLPFLVPSVRSIRFNSANSTWDAEAAAVLLGLVKHRNVQVSDIVYAGHVTRRVVIQILQFPTLRSARVLPTAGGQNLVEASDIITFQPLTSLTNLDIDLGIFRPPSSDIGGWIQSLRSLSTLCLQGAASMIIDCMQNRTFSLVHTLNLFLRREPTGISVVWPNIITIISAAFPTLLSLCLEHKENYELSSAGITLSDIHVLRDRPMQCLVIRCLRFSLSCPNIVDIVKIWPSLERLSLVPESKHYIERYNAKKLLPYISRHAPHVTYMSLPLDISSLITAQPLIVQRTVCPLQRLELPQVHNLPSDLKGKLMLAQNLLTLFPRLNEVTSNVDIRELQMIIKSFREILSSPPRRNDNLF
ncbi:hypothetical protein AGABI2DRAFT_120989 [Agaricus bisporus var. bisporus H97]|uniref:hypothetical protein n=1 Tax=Agaricus bisporus var. bisporus (strain H97 / ATCC MYA-4626 / FGSC 10389) TaxID=936046 RepID=UPI00029F7704|nr:hypothetical protein AGABI2DRAFT_120989 [Agaricus bisporus var. bisporus H97]EKV43772.1 hypothetical protein AGABI2DRAFT_120989 [Agaricus bisporus var. bisporus H97]